MPRYGADSVSVKPLPWRKHPEILKELVKASLEGNSDRDLAREFKMSPAKVSRWLADSRIEEVIGRSTYQKLKAKRTGRIKTNLPCQLRDADTGFAVGLFRQATGYSSYGPRQRYSEDVRSRVHSLIRWPQFELEAAVFALCQIHPSTSVEMARGFLAESGERIEIQFARRGPSSREFERFMAFAEKFASRRRDKGGLAQNLMAAVERARKNKLNPLLAIQVAERLLSLITLDRRFEVPAWFRKLVALDPMDERVLGFRKKSDRRSIRVVWRKDALMDCDFIYADIEPDGHISDVFTEVPSGGGKINYRLRRQIEICRKKFLKRLSKIRLHSSEA